MSEKTKKVSSTEWFYFLNSLFWSRVDLQCCVTFRSTAKCISYPYIHTYIGPPWWVPNTHTHPLLFRFHSHVRTIK